MSKPQHDRSEWAHRARAVPQWLLPLVVTLIVLAGLAGLVWVDAYWITQIVWEGRTLLPWIELSVLVVVLMIMAGWLGGEQRGPVLIVLAAVAGVGGAVLLFLWSSYQSDRGYLANLDVVTRPLPALAPRAPYLVGEAQAGTSLGDLSGDISDTTYLSDQDRFSSLVVRRGWLSGYEAAFSQRVPLTGRGETGQRCTFDTARASARIGGHFTHSLGRKINQQDRFVTYDDEDVYSYCSGITPVVVVPLKRQIGLFAVQERPAGVAVYNGRTGQLTLSVAPVGLQGHAYPMSLAARQREALTATGSFSDWLARRSGWVASDDGTNDGNDSEFTLDRSDGSGSVYLTPLTARGTTSSIVSVSSIPAQHTGRSLAPLTVHRLARAWVSPEAVAQRIRSDYRDACCYNDDRVFEVIPTGGDSWVATMGSPQNLTYRVRGNGQLEGPEATCLETADGQPIRCGQVAAKDPVTVPDGKDITTLDTEDLLKLQNEVSAEIARRLRG